MARNNFSDRLGRQIRRALQTSIFRFSVIVPCVLLTFQLSAAPQRAEEDDPSAGATSSAQTSSLATDFPQLPYQGSPAEIPQDEGAVGLRLQLRRLSTTARLMQTVAHPDDEDGGMLTLEARGRGDDVLLMTLNRGEGGQNKVGNNLSDVLGVVRTLELLAADEYYGVQERFSRVADFGFSKTAEETFQKWGGHDIALGDMVRVIRTFRPDVLVARFSGTPRDGHGNHQASSILTKEAFRAAADPSRFPQQIKEGLEPWQAKKLYIGNVCGFGAMTCPDADWTVKLNTGEPSADLGGSYIQFAMKGLRHQLSQGAANWNVEPGDRFTFYRLVDSIEPAKLGKDGHEKDFFDGIDTSLPGLASRLGNEESKLPKLRSELEEIAKKVTAASEAAKARDTESGVGPLAEIVAGLDRVRGEVENADLNAIAKSDLLGRLADKREQAAAALNDALGTSLSATVVSRAEPKPPVPKEADATTTVSPGQEFLVATDFHNGSKERLLLDGIKLEVPKGWATISDKTRPVYIKPGENVRAVFRLKVPADAEYTRPYWHRDDPDTESLNHIDNEEYATLPFPPPTLRAQVTYSVARTAGAAVKNEIGATV
ncbi:MAG TPA: PIG-L family deacetylase, partial [Candidatus Sulfotelmatobacter sp.]